MEADPASLVSPRDRHLLWDGCFNARDLGGLRTSHGRETRWGAVVRSEAPHLLTAEGWSALYAHGIRTIIDLRNADEIKPDIATRPAVLPTIRLPLDRAEDAEFWAGRATAAQFGTPVYYRTFLEYFPHRIASVLGAIAQARPGGVLVHCAQGRDRTGLVTLVLLALVGVVTEDIAADYVMSGHRLTPLFERLGQQDQALAIEAYLTGAGTSAKEIIISTLAGLNAETYLRSAGLDDRALDALRTRLLTG